MFITLKNSCRLSQIKIFLQLQPSNIFTVRIQMQFIRRKLSKKLINKTIMMTLEMN